MEQNLPLAPGVHGDAAGIRSDLPVRGPRGSRGAGAARDARRSLAMAEKDQRPESALRTASFATERLATWIGARDRMPLFSSPSGVCNMPGGRVTFQEPTPLPSYGWPVAGRSRPALCPCGRRKARWALTARSRALAEQSVAVMAELQEPQMVNWPRDTREQSKRWRTLSVRVPLRFQFNCRVRTPYCKRIGCHVLGVIESPRGFRALNQSLEPALRRAMGRMTFEMPLDFA